MLLQQLITFSRVVEEGSFTRAADLLSLSQPAVTRQVATLESELGVVLTERAGRGFHLPPAGEIVNRYAREVVALVERCRDEVAALVPETGRPAWEDVLAAIEVPRPGLAQRLLVRVGLSQADSLVASSAPTRTPS